MTQYTAGPWEVVDISDNPPTASIWADAIEDQDKTLCHDIYGVADAYLIAAAPDLLAACEAVVAFNRHERNCNQCDNTCEDGARLAIDAANSLRHAIAKAHGQVAL